MDFYSEVLIVTGGAAIGGMNRSVELLNMDGSHICNLPALPNSWVDQERAGKADFFMDHTQTGLVTCGGGGFHNGRQKYCVTFNPDEGSWQETHILQKAYTTTEILTNNGDTQTTDPRSGWRLNSSHRRSWQHSANVSEKKCL